MEKQKKEDLPYNKPFTDRELKTVIKQQNNTAPGEDTNHPQIIKNLPPKTLKYLLDMYNKFWEEGEIQYNTIRKIFIAPKILLTPNIIYKI